MNEITGTHKRLSYFYKGYRMTPMIDEDLKLIKKLNVIFGKLEKTGKDTYFLEAINIMKTLNNVLKIKDMQEIFLELINLNYQQVVLHMITNIDKIDANALRTFVEEEEEDTDGD